MNCWQRYSQNLVYKWTVSPPSPSSVSMGLGNVMFGKSCTHSCSVFVWLFSDERRSVQPSNQVHRSLHRPSQHLHRNRVLSQRKPAGNVKKLPVACKMCKKIAFTWKEQQCQSDFMCHELFPHVQILIYMWKKPNTCECDSFTWENVSFTCEKIGSLSFLVLRKGINIDFISVSNCENPSTYSSSNQNCVCTESGTKWLGESFLQAGFSDVTTRNQSRSRMKLPVCDVQTSGHRH